MSVEDIQTIEPYTALRRFTPEVTHELRRIDAALERIKVADVWPATAEALRFSAQVGTIHYSTLIEGNRLGFLEAERAARGELDARTKAEIELVNQVDALNLLDRRMGADRLRFSEDLFKKVHYEVTKGLGAWVRMGRGCGEGGSGSVRMVAVACAAMTRSAGQAGDGRSGLGRPVHGPSECPGALMRSG